MRVYQKHFQLRSKEFDIDLNTYATICKRSFVHIYIVPREYNRGIHVYIFINNIEETSTNKFTFMITVNLKNKSSVCQRSSDQFYIVTSYIKWVTISWTDGTLDLSIFIWQLAKKWTYCKYSW